MSSEPKRNRLAGETSPYLLQHASNPVDWFPWGPEALNRAEELDRPILLSIGYAACHWCHVMERESFENDEIAALMNQHFVCIKVDREERPDLDEIYMAATVAISGSGGWPMTVFLTPDQRPFFAGTYFPPADMPGRAGFPQILKRVSQLWADEADKVRSQSAELSAHIIGQSTPPRPRVVNDSALTQAVQQLASSYDSQFGGFGPAPKFPAAASIRLLLRHSLRTGDEMAREMACSTLNAMQDGGIYDHIGGGFARYATDRHWLVPHFEKMLYDNAQLVSAYLEAYQLTANENYARVARECLDYVIRDMQSEQGGYYSATDADSEGVEGKFFVWTPAQIQDVLGESEAKRLCAYYDITDRGNWEGTNIPNTPRSYVEVAASLDIEPAGLADSVREGKKLLFTARKARPAPLLDDKILVSWNGLMISAMVAGARVLGTTAYLESAQKAASFILTRMRKPDGGLYRTTRHTDKGDKGDKGDNAHLDAYLEDYAFLADGLLDLYELSGTPASLDNATEMTERMLRDFADKDGGAFYQTATTHETLIVRRREGSDGAIPNANAIAARCIARLSYHLDKPELRTIAAQAIRAYGRVIETAPRAFASSLISLDFLLESPTEIVFVGNPDKADTRALARELSRHYLPNRVEARISTGEEYPRLPLLESKTLVDGRAAIYLCHDFRCEKPITDPMDLRAALESPIDRQRAAALRATAVSGRATAVGTLRLSLRHEKSYQGHGYAVLGTTELQVSRVGIGSHRLHDGSSDHRQTVDLALRAGLNLLDTAANYTDGHSETLLGEALAESFANQQLKRDELVIISKFGTLQGSGQKRARDRLGKGRELSALSQRTEQLWHHLDPVLMSAELTESLGRLNLETLDGFLLQDPELYLLDAIDNGRDPEAAKTAFYKQLVRLFGALEREVAQGRIGFYGVASEAWVRPPSDAIAIDLGRVMEAAVAAGGESHHFAVIEVPLNLFEAGAVNEPSVDSGDGNLQTTLEFAFQKQLGVLSTRPLDAALQHSRVRLVQPAASSHAPELLASCQVLEKLEAQFEEKLSPQLTALSGFEFDPETLLRYAPEFAQLGDELESLEHWEELQGEILAPRVLAQLQRFDREFRGPASQIWEPWRQKYVGALDACLTALAAVATRISEQRSQKIVDAFARTLPDDGRRVSLTELAIWSALSCEGVTATLLGMRRSRHVSAAMQTLSRETNESLSDLPGSVDGDKLGL
ncbi:MAG: DUF255 domain-containing protein [Polyangiaceae bacterium]|nr:DUF255 domain-containing protein [Polyangiaceae bacterium]